MTNIFILLQLLWKVSCFQIWRLRVTNKERTKMWTRHSLLTFSPFRPFPHLHTRNMWMAPKPARHLRAKFEMEICRTACLFDMMLAHLFVYFCLFAFYLFVCLFVCELACVLLCLYSTKYLRLLNTSICV